MKTHKRFIIALAGSLLLAGCTLPSQSGQEIPGTVHTEPTISVETSTVPTGPTGIPILLPTVEAKEPADTDIVRVQDYIPDIVVELRYATENNFTGKVIYTFDEAYLRYGTVKKLAQIQQMLKGYGLGLKLWDAYRPLYGQQSLWDACPDPNYVSRPGTGVQAHCRGHAVDITLVDLQGNDVAMPSDFDNFTALGDKDYSDCSQDAAYYAGVLDYVMRMGGFYGYHKEWWHFVDYDDYSIEDLFDPTVVSTWQADCEDRIPLRVAAATAIGPYMYICRGETMTVLGWFNDFAYVDYAGYRGFVEKNDIVKLDN